MHIPMDETGVGSLAERRRIEELTASQMERIAALEGRLAAEGETRADLEGELEAVTGLLGALVQRLGGAVELEPGEVEGLLAEHEVVFESGLSGGVLVRIGRRPAVDEVTTG